MHFIQFAIRNPVKVAVAVILAVLFGGIAYFATPVRLTPEVEEPEITITTIWRGAGAQEVEEQIVEQQEEYLKTVEGLREFKSTSADGVATIELKFAVGTDLGVAAARVRDKLNQVPSYPENVDQPVVTTVNPNANAVAWFMLKPLPPTKPDLEAFVERHPDMRPVLAPMIEGKIPIELTVLTKWSRKHPKLKALVTGRHEPAKMRKFAQDFIEARLERVAGVANANVLGGREQEFHIVVDPAKLAAKRLTIDDLTQALRRNNQNVSGGDIREGKAANRVRTIGLYTSPERVAETEIAFRDNAAVKVKDIVQTVDGQPQIGVRYRKPEGVVRQSGIDSLAVNAQQAPGSNLIEVMGPPLKVLDRDGDGEITETELIWAKRTYGDSIRIAVAELNNGVLKQQGLMLEQVYDQTEYLTSATALVQNNIYLGGTLAVLVLLLFLRSPRSVLIIGLSIPISVIATFIFIRGFGRSINVISLAGMAFAVGMVVDNAIVVLENIFRHYQNGEDPETAASKGAQEVWGAVLASTLTTLAVFIPVIFVQGQAGQLFRDIAIAISCAVGLSLIVSITVIPTAAKRILKPGRSPLLFALFIVVAITAEVWAAIALVARGHTVWAAVMSLASLAILCVVSLAFFSNRFLRAIRRALSPLFWIGGRILDFSRRINDGFAAGINKLQTMPGNIAIRTSIIVLFVTVSIFGAFLLAPKTEYLPEGNRNLVIAMMMPPPGYSVEKMIALGEEEIEPKVSKYWEAEPGSPEEAALDGPPIKNFFFVARGNMLFMGARTRDPLRAAELVPVMNRTASSVPGVIGFATQASLFDRALSGGRRIDIEITGPDLEVLVAQGQKAFGLIMQHLPGSRIRPEPSLDLSSPETHVVAKDVKAAEAQLDTRKLGDIVNAYVDGAFVGEYWHEGRKIDLMIIGPQKYARHSHLVGELPIVTPNGTITTVGSVADVKIARGPERIQHSERVRTITLQVTPAKEMPLETALDLIDEHVRKPMLATQTFEGGQYQIRLAGTANKLNDTRRELQWNLLLALVITYLLMAALFESFFYPLIIMTSVVLALVGGFGGLAVLNLFIHQPLDMLTMLGFVILIGTVVNNAILIVHQALNHMREDGMAPKDAVVESVRTRVRPIFMSTLTTVLGMAPLVLPMPDFHEGGIRWAPGAGSELYRGLGSVVLGGLIVSTVFTLVLVPTAFSLAVDIKAALARLLGWTAPETQPALAAIGPSGQMQRIPVDAPLALRDGARASASANGDGEAATSNGDGQPRESKPEPIATGGSKGTSSP